MSLEDIKNELITAALGFIGMGITYRTGLKRQKAETENIAQEAVKQAIGNIKEATDLRFDYLNTTIIELKQVTEDLKIKVKECEEHRR
jgi:hypothetical protein